MRQTLPDYIKQHEELRQSLIAQEGGIMKYLAEHLDADGTAELFHGYQDLCVEKFHERNKWDYGKVWEGEDMRRAALGEMEHLWRELRYLEALRPFLAELSSEVAERIDWFTDLYLTYAYKQNRLRRHPNGMTDAEVYQEIIWMYHPQGLAYKCMEFILQEHNARGNVEKTGPDLLTEFLIRQWSDQLTLGAFAQMRKAVADMLRGKTDEHCRQMAIETMKKVRGFSQMIYTDVVVQHLREINVTNDADKRESDGEWLRDVAQHAVFEEFSSKHTKPYSLRYYFANFVNLLQDVGRIWAAQLLVRGIDMKKLETEVCCILKPEDSAHYYVDKCYIEDMPDQYCIANDEQAELWLKKMSQESHDDGRRKKAKTPKKPKPKKNKNKWFTTATFTYTGMKSDLFKDTRLEVVSSSLITHFVKGTIKDKDGQTIDYKQYVNDLFSGTCINAENTLVWKGNMVELAYLFRELHRHKRIEWHEDELLWNIVASHFKIETELKSGKVKKCNVTPDSLGHYHAKPKADIKKLLDAIISYFNPDMSELISGKKTDLEEETENERNQTMAKNDYSDELARERDRYKNMR
jgi:hypothetical protein